MNTRTRAPAHPAGTVTVTMGCLVLAALAGCASTPPAQPTTAPTTALSNSVAAPPDQRGASALSYGVVTVAVERGKTTQLDLIQLFGGPNISTTDGEGVETWVYERSVSQTDAASKSNQWQAAANLGLSFGHVQLGASGGGGSSGAGYSSASSFRSLTVIVKFNSNKTVKDYSVRASQF